MPKATFASRVQTLSTLLEPTRHRLYRYVADRRAAITRDEAADALQISLAAAAFHLDRLVAAGLLRASYRRTASGPALGAGRPSKLYRRSGRRVEVAIPQREHQLMSGLLAEAAATSADARSLDDVAHEYGLSLGARARASAHGDDEGALAKCIEKVSADLGFEPTRTDAGELWARNCPFDPVSRRQPAVVCRTAVALLRGVVDGVGASGISVGREERPGWCCVIQRASRSAAGDDGNKTATRLR